MMRRSSPAFARRDSARSTAARLPISRKSLAVHTQCPLCPLALMRHMILSATSLTSTSSPAMQPAWRLRTSIGFEAVFPRSRRVAVRFVNERSAPSVRVKVLGSDKPGKRSYVNKITTTCGRVKRQYGIFLHPRELACAMSCVLAGMAAYHQLRRTAENPCRKLCLSKKTYKVFFSLKKSSKRCKQPPFVRSFLPALVESIKMMIPKGQSNAAQLARTGEQKSKSRKKHKTADRSS